MSGPNSIHKLNPVPFAFPLNKKRFGTLRNLTATLYQVDLELSADGGGLEVDDFFNGWAWIYITSGAARGSSVRITDFDNATGVAIFDRPLLAVPGADTYVIVTGLRSDFMLVQCAGAGGVDTISLPLSCGIRNDFWNGCPIDLVDGAGGNVNRPAQRRRILKYDGASQVAIVDGRWETPPDGTTWARLHGILYQPCNELQLFEQGGAGILIEPIKGRIAYNDNPLSELNSGDEPSMASFCDVAMQKTAADGVLRGIRWEG